MRKAGILLFSIIMSLLMSVPGKAQTYDQTAPYQPIVSGPHTFTFSFTGLPTSGIAYANARVYVYYYGDFGDYSEWIWVENPFGDTLGKAGPYSSGIDCDFEDTAVFSFPAAQLISLGGTANFSLTTTGAVDVACTSPQIGARLVFDYCTQGTQSDIATITTMAADICPGNGPLALSGTPAGGTWTGPGISGNNFIANNLPLGTYTIRYSTSSGGCNSYDELNLHVQGHPPATSLSTACGPHIDTLVSTSQSPYLNWYSDAALTNMIGTGDTFYTGTINSDSTFYAAFYSPAYTDSFTAMTANNPLTLTGVEFTSGDDRGGIAVTNNYVYLVGDMGTARYDLNFSNGVALPGMASIFTDLATGQLYTLYNTTDAQAVPVFAQYSNYVADAIRTLNADLTYGSQIIPLETPIALNATTFSSLMLAGFGKMAVVDPNHCYIIDLTWGGVEDLGAGFDVPNEAYSSETWAAWGLLEYDGSNYSALFRDGTGGQNIMRRQMPAGTIDTAFAFTNLSDMTNFTYSASTQRWYFHWEGSSQFGGNDENLAYADAGVDTSSGYQFSCATPVRLRGFPQINLGNDTTVCNGGQGITLDAGSGFDTYTWDGVTGTSTHQADSTKDYVVVVTDSIGCTATDTIHITIDCTNVKAVAGNEGVTIYPNPNSGNFTLQLDGWNGKTDIVITDLAGRVIYDQETAVAGNSRSNISIDNVATGMYILRISSGSRQAIYKLEVRR